jgi:hypothetical protein
MAEDQLPNNSKIAAEQTHIPDVDDTRNYRPLFNVNIYEFMRHAYYGTGGIRDGSFLIPFQREIFYDRRRQGCWYSNFVRDIINAYIEPVYSNAFRRTVSVNNNEIQDGMYVHEFLKNSDNSGNSFHEFMSSTMTEAHRNGVTFIVVDNYDQSELPNTFKEAIDERILPYVYTKSAETWDGWEFDKYGRLLWIRFYEGEKIVIENNISIVQYKYSYWDKTIYRELTKRKDNPAYIVAKEIAHGLDEIPVVIVATAKPCLTGMKLNIKEIYDPPMYDIARANLALFNRCSEIDDQIRAQSFSIFVIQSDDEGDETIGLHNILYYPIEAKNPPGYASPDSSILSGLIDNREKMKEMIFLMARQRGVIGVEVAKSGAAIEWEFTAENTELQKTASLAKKAEDKIISLFKKYTNEDFEYNAEYPDDFMPSNDTQEIADYDKVSLMDLPPRPSLFLKKLAFLKVVKDQDKDIVANMAKDFDAAMEMIANNPTTEEKDDGSGESEA